MSKRRRAAIPGFTLGHFQRQISSRFNDNYDVFEDSLDVAVQSRLDLISFPECFLTGYFETEKETRASALRIDGAKIRKVLRATVKFDGAVVIGFNEWRGTDIYNSVLVAKKGRLLGVYSKCMAYMPFHRRGREFPVFEHKGMRFGVLICADGGYIEPARILALKGARLIVAPHYNYINSRDVFSHYHNVRGDHVARAVENRIWFLRANNVVHGRDPKFKSPGIGYGDSYLLNPRGEVAAQSSLQQEDTLVARIDPAQFLNPVRRPVVSFAELGDIWLREFNAAKLNKYENESIRYRPEPALSGAKGLKRPGKNPHNSF